ncbi:MAG: InlB B-repeat-containing protein [Eubacterium sp.]
MQYVYGNKVVLKDAKKNGTKFAGWYTDSKYTNRITEITDKTVGNLECTPDLKMKLQHP